MWGPGGDMPKAADDENHPETEIANVRIHPDILLRAVDELNRPDLAEEEITASVARTLARAAEVFGVTGVGLMLTDPADQTLRYVAATDALAARLEAAQEESGEGPCVEAFVLNRTVATPDVRVDPRWPTLQRMPNLGDVAAVLGVPTRLGSEPIGSLNAYSSEPRIWDESEIAAIAAFNELLESRLAAATWAQSRSRQRPLRAAPTRARPTGPDRARSRIHHGSLRARCGGGVPVDTQLRTTPPAQGRRCDRGDLGWRRVRGDHPGNLGAGRRIRDDVTGVPGVPACAKNLGPCAFERCHT